MAVVDAGVWQIYRPAAWILAGLVLIATGAVLGDRSRKIQ